MNDAGQLDQAQRRRHDEVLADIARFAGSSIDLNDVLNRIVERAAQLTGADRASIWLLDRTGERLLPSALFGMDAAFAADWKTRPLPLKREPLSREVIATGQPVIVEDAASDPRTDKASVNFFGDRSMLVAPLVIRQRIIGTLFLNHVRTPYQFTTEDVVTTEAIAYQAAIAIDNAQLYHDTRRLAEQLRRSFQHAGEALAAGVALPQALQQMVHLAVETVGAQAGSLQLLDEAGRGTYLAASAGEPPAETPPQQFPLVAESQLLGTLLLWRTAPPFDEEELSLLSAFAGHARAAIEHARLYTSLQEERERARQAEKTQTEFLSMISHELRTPLALITGYISTLRHPDLKLTPDQTLRFLEGIDSAAARLRRLIDNLLSITGLDAGLTRPQPQRLEVEALIQRAIQEVLETDAGAHVEVEVPEPLWVLGDIDQLTQVFQNRLGNALKYAPGESPARVTAQPAGDRVLISVADRGPGIPPQALQLIFEKFYRVQSSIPSAGESGAADGSETSGPRDSGKPGGLGLGLYICRRIVEAHGGRIWAENLPAGGAALRVELPAALPEAPHENDASRPLVDAGSPT